MSVHLKKLDIVIIAIIGAAILVFLYSFCDFRFVSFSKLTYAEKMSLDNPDECLVIGGQCCKNGGCSTKNNFCENGYSPSLEGCDADCNPIVSCQGGCWHAGGTFSSGGKDKCCEGLTPVSDVGMNVITGECGNAYNSVICLKCGDGICGSDENVCNCPQDCKERLGCVKEGEISYDTMRVCCGILEAKYIFGCTDGVMPCTLFPSKMTCVNQSSLAQDTMCAKEDEILAGENRPCCFGLKQESISGLFGGDSYICKKTFRWCADDGEAVYNNTFGEPARCCDPNAGIARGNSCDSKYLGTCVKDWNKTCGNGKCELGENSCSCPQDCKNPACEPVICM